MYIISRDSWISRITAFMMFKWNIFFATSEVSNLANKNIQNIKDQLEKCSGSFSKTAFICIDPQNDFVSGSLGGNTESIIKERKKALQVAYLIALFMKSQGSFVLITADKHPKEHVSFAKTHEKEPFNKINMPSSVANNWSKTDYQMIWPEHCVKGTWGG